MNWRYAFILIQSLNVLPHVLVVEIPIDVELLLCPDTVFKHFFRFLLCLFGWKSYIDGKFESIIQHAREILSKNGAWLRQTRVRIDLNEPGITELVNHEIVPKQLITVLVTHRIEFATVNAFQTDLNYASDLSV